MCCGIIAAGALWGVWLGCGSAPAQETPAKAALAAANPPLTSAFQLPRLARSSSQLFEQAAVFVRQRDWKRAEELGNKALEQAPQLPSNHYNLGCLLALSGKKDEAFERLDHAVELGFRDAVKLEHDVDLESLRSDERFAQLVKKIREKPKTLVAPVPLTARAIDQNVAWVGPSNAAWDPSLNVLRTLFEPASSMPTVPVVKDHGVVGEKLRRWFSEGTAAGHVGDLYDNCDRDHSNLNYGAFPQLTRVEYEREIQADVPFGLQLLLFHGGVVLGNSSTAHVGSPFWRSNPRTAYVNSHAVGLLFAQYRSNHLYIYPEHRDHDPGHDGKENGYGDVFPANTPYLITSQGSSGSDQVFLDAIACTLAAFQPAVKKRLIENGLLMPAVQMVFRASNKNVARPDDYLSGVAHPTAFDGRQLNVEKMIDMAHAMKPDALPPWVEIRVVEEDVFEPGRDYFDISAREKLFDTPCSIARIYRATASRRKMVVSAEASRDLDGKPLTYRWVVLRGDDKSVTINPLNESGSIAQLSIPYAPRRPIREGDQIESNRTDIGVFVHNGHYHSPPAFVTCFTLDNEDRVYDSAGRIQQVTYHGESDPGHYVDPVIDLPKSWTDEYHYDEAGQSIGWSRMRGEAKEEFTPEGALVTERDARGRPLVARSVRYLARPRPNNQPPILVQELGPTRLRYRYQSDVDRIGEVASREPFE